MKEIDKEKLIIDAKRIRSYLRDEIKMISNSLERLDKGEDVYNSLDFVVKDWFDVLDTMGVDELDEDD